MAHIHGVVLKHSGVVQLAIPIIVLGPLLLEGSWAIGKHIAYNPITDMHWFLVFLQAVSCIARFSFLILLWRRSADERCFMLNVMAKIVAPVLFFEIMLPAVTAQHSILAAKTFYHLSYMAVFVFAFLGIRGTLKLPFGPWFVEIMLNRILTCKVISHQHSRMDPSPSEMSAMEELSPLSPNVFGQEFGSDGSEAFWMGESDSEVHSWR